VDAGELVRAAAAGDRAAWNLLVERFTGLLWSIARAHRLAEPDAADVVQTTWLRLVEHLERIAEPDRVGAWLATTARRECLRTIRARGRLVPVDDEGLPDLVSDAPPELGLVLAERDTSVWRAFSLLSERCRTLLRILMADPAPSYEEVSAALELPIGSIGPTRGRCLERLRANLARLGITSETAGS
jgi:RNA polymerase sigma factor (sigma-70 family)